MRKVFLVLLGLSLSNTGGFCQRVEASEDAAPISFGAEVDANSKYIWRGIVCEDHPVIQPTAWVTANGFTVSVWDNHTSQAARDWTHANEVDLSASYSRALKGLESEVSFCYYNYPGQEDSPPTGELSAKIGVPFSGFSLTTSHSFDVVKYPGSYYGDAALGFEHEMIWGLSAELMIAGGWSSAEFNETYWGLRKPALNLISGAAAVNWPLGARFYAKPHLEWYHLSDSDLAAGMKPNLVNFGGTIGFEW